jgi:sigma-E factor negative regulatory protein RseA
MQEKLNEQLSMLVDDQLHSQQACNLLKTLHHDAQLQAKFKHYQLISQALKGDSCLTASSDFAEQLQRKLRDEPTYLLPRQAKRSVDWQKTLGLAAAASVAMVAVLVFSNSEKHTQPFSRGNEIAAAHVTAPDNAKFKEYLQAHDNTWYANNHVGAQQYARLAGFQQK